MAYDIRYPSTAIASTHPARMSAQAIIAGVQYQFSPKFRYLEFACGNGSNLLALAQAFPDAEFIGVDINEEAVRRGQQRAVQAGLTNVVLKVGDIKHAALEGPFEYVVAHGVYSWIDAETQAALLERTASLLTPNGVGYVSYNVLPGWGVRGVVRDVMRAAAAQHTTEALRLKAAKLMVGRIKAHIPQNNPYGVLMSSELSFIAERHAGYLLGEYLAEYNEPVYVNEFLSRAEKHGLVYLAEQLGATTDGFLEQTLPFELMEAGVPFAEAQRLLDVMCYRQFRATLLCLKQNKPRHQPDMNALRDTGYFCGKITPKAQEPLLAPGHALQFETEAGAVIEASDPLPKACLLLLGSIWPRGIQLSELMTRAVQELRARGLWEQAGVTPESLESTVHDLVGLAERRQVELLPWQPNIPEEIPARLQVSPLTRLEAEERRVTTPRHDVLALDSFRAQLVELLDGRLDVPGLVRELLALKQAGELVLDEEYLPLFENPKQLTSLVVAALQEVHQKGLFVRESGQPSMRSIEQQSAVRLEPIRLLEE